MTRSKSLVYTTGAIHSLLKRAGLDVRRHRDPLQFVRSHAIATVLDVGANEGQFARAIRQVLPAAEIHSFEPLGQPFKALLRDQSGDARRFAYPLALGESDGEVTMEQNEFSPSSSLLPCTSLHRAEFPFAVQTARQSVRMTTLDAWRKDRALRQSILLKIDVQGYEDRVLRGACSLLAETAVVIVEVSFVALYQGQMLFDGIHEMLRQNGFRCSGMIENLAHSQSGAILQSNAIFLNQTDTRTV